MMMNYSDPLFEKAARIVVEYGVCSIAMLQEQLAIGSKRTIRILTQLDQTGIISFSISLPEFKVLIPNKSKLIKYLKRLNKEDLPLYVPDETSNLKGETEIVCDSQDPLFMEASHIVVETQNCSFSHLQRRLSIGYNRVQIIMTQLEQKGVINYSINKEEQRVLFTNCKKLDEHLKNIDCC